MGPETLHVLEACLRDRPVMVEPAHARLVMESYSAADISAELNEPVSLPLTNAALAQLADMKKAMSPGI
jgi:myo-inositol 2-dehydrogenase/D-chiro-inositol 1-dehydrogenase